MGTFGKAFKVTLGIGAACVLLLVLVVGGLAGLEAYGDHRRVEKLREETAAIKAEAAREALWDKR